MIARWILVLTMIAIILALHSHTGVKAEELDPFAIQEIFSRFPFAEVVSLDEGDGWGLLYADVYGKLHLLKATNKGWKLEWELANLTSKIRKFFVTDIEQDGSDEIIVATVNGRILVYSMYDYSNLWENIEDKFTRIAAMEIENIDNDPQLEFIILADGYLYIFDGKNKSRQWVSERELEAVEIVVDNVDQDDQLEIILNTGFVIDTRFFNVELELGKSFGDRITVFDINNDGYPEVIGEDQEYSLRIFDVYAKREVW